MLCQAINAPPRAGPLTEATDCSVELTVIALENRWRGTVIGKSTWRAGPSKADATPIRKTSPYTSRMETWPVAIEASITSVPSNGMVCDAMSTMRRS